MKNNNDMTQMLELSNKDFKRSHDKNASVIINTVESLSKETVSTKKQGKKKNHTEILEVKNN